MTWARRLAGAVVVVAGLWASALTVPGTALAGWGPPEPVEKNIDQIFLAPGGPGFVTGFPGGAPLRLRFELRPLAGTLEAPMEFPGAIGKLDFPVLGFAENGDAVIVDPEAHQVGFRSAAGVETTQELTGKLFHREPRAVSVAPTGEALIGLNTSGGSGRAVQLAFRSAGEKGTVDMVNTVELSNEGKLIGIQLQANGGAVAVWADGKTGALWQVVRRAGQTEFDAPTEIKVPGEPGVYEPNFASDPSGWAMLSWYGKSGSQWSALASARAPDGSFPEASVLATGESITNVTPAVTAAGDGLVAWKQTGLAGPTCPSFGIRGASEHLGAWAPAMNIGPTVWPEGSIPGFASTAFGSGNDISVPITRVYHTGTGCNPYPQTRSLIVHHYRSGSSGLTDQGTSELTSPSPESNVSVDGWAMEPAGRIFAWYGVGEERFLNVFDGVTPGAGAGTPPTETATTTTPVASTTPAATPTTPPSPKVIKPLVVQEFVNIKPIDPRSLEFEMTCPPVGEEVCTSHAEFYYTFTGKQIKAYGARHTVAKQHLDVIASGTLTLTPGHKGHLKLHPNRLGKALLKTGAMLKITVKLTVTRGARSVTGTVPTTIKAPRGHKGTHKKH